MSKLRGIHFSLMNFFIDYLIASINSYEYSTKLKITPKNSISNNIEIERFYFDAKSKIVL